MPSPKEQWIQALQSGEYPQGEGALRTQDRYCCLGVLCDIYQKETHDGRWVANDDPAPVVATDYYFQTPTGSNSKLPPVEVMDWLGMGMDSGMATFLASGNDLGVKFATLASILDSVEYPNGAWVDQMNQAIKHVRHTKQIQLST